MQPGTDYFIRIVGTVDLFRNSAGASYPYVLDDYITIFKANTSSTGYYYFFYDWHVVDKCESTPLTEGVGYI